MVSREICRVRKAIRRNTWTAVGIASLALAFLVPASPAAAEQPAAAEYRQMFQSGRFFVEYVDRYGKHLLGSTDGQRLGRTSYKSVPGWVAALNPLGALFGGGGAKNPEVIHQDGKYYQFKKDREGELYVVMLEETRLDEENLDPRDGWKDIPRKLALPDELAVFCWNDPYRGQIPGVKAPRYFVSGQMTIGGQTYDSDAYLADIRAADGSRVGQLRYDLMYKSGRLAYIETRLLDDGGERLINTLEVTALQSAIPEGAFKIKANTKVYAAGVGDMNDLLGQLVQVGVLNPGNG